MFGVADDAVVEAIGTYVKLMRAYRSVSGRIEALVGAEGLTLTQVGVLEGVLHKGPMTHRELGRKVLTSAGNMTDVVDKLEGRGLVRRVRADADRRQVRVELTSAGRALIENLFPRHAKDIARVMSALDDGELRQLGALLRKLGIAAAHDDEVPHLVGSEGDTHFTA